MKEPKRNRRKTPGPKGMAPSNIFVVKGKLWKYSGPAAWYFVTIGEKEAREIRFVESSKKVGWGYIRILARIGDTQWSTTLFPTKKKEFLLAVKSQVRKAEGLEGGDTVTVEFELEMEGEGVPSDPLRASLHTGNTAGPENPRRK